MRDYNIYVLTDEKAGKPLIYLGKYKGVFVDNGKGSCYYKV